MRNYLETIIGLATLTVVCVFTCLVCCISVMTPVKKLIQCIEKKKINNNSQGVCTYSQSQSGWSISAPSGKLLLLNKIIRSLPLKDIQ